MGKIILTVSPLPTWESISDIPKMVSQTGRAFPTLRKSFPNLGGHFRRSENRFPTWEGISDIPKMVSQTGRAFPTLRKSFPNLGGHFRRSENRFPTWEGISDAPEKRFSAIKGLYSSVFRNADAMSIGFCKNKNSPRNGCRHFTFRGEFKG